MSCSQTQAIPKQADYRFSGSPILKKQGDYAAIIIAPLNPNAQRGAADKSVRPGSVFIDSNDFAEIWKDLSAIDFSTLKEVPDSGFEASPPDVLWLEKLVLIVDDTSVVNWSHRDGRLVSSRRKPLNKLEKKLEKVFDKRLDSPAIPDQFVFDISIPGSNGKRELRLEKQGDAITLRSSDLPEAVRVEKKAFRDYFRNFQKNRVASADYGMALPMGGPEDTISNWSLTVTINGYVVAGQNLSEGNINREMFERVWADLKKLVQ